MVKYQSTSNNLVTLWPVLAYDDNLLTLRYFIVFYDEANKIS